MTSPCKEHRIAIERTHHQQSPPCTRNRSQASSQQATPVSNKDANTTTSISDTSADDLASSCDLPSEVCIAAVVARETSLSTSKRWSMSPPWSAPVGEAAERQTHHGQEYGDGAATRSKAPLGRQSCGTPPRRTYTMKTRCSESGGLQEEAQPCVQCDEIMRATKRECQGLTRHVEKT